MSFLNSLKSLLGMEVEVEQAPIVVAPEPAAAPVAAPAAEPIVAAPVAPIAPEPVVEATPVAAVENIMNDPMVEPHMEVAPVINTHLDTNIEIMEPAPVATPTENA